MQDVEYRRLINKDKELLTRLDKLILRCYSAKSDLSDLDLTSEMIYYLRNKQKLSVRDELMLKMLTSDEDLAKFDLQELMKKILSLKTQLADKEKQLTNKQMKEMMLLQVIEGTVSTKNM